ncbi:hypothetical protein INR49_020769, partial [Caranx melampygus]
FFTGVRSASGAAFPRVVPDRRVFAVYDNVSVSCEDVGGSSEWRVMKKLNAAPAESSTWNTSAPSYHIYPAYEKHSGQYWCEDEAERQSGAVNITVIRSYVILEISPHPVMEGSNVTLHCRNKKNQSTIAYFYRGSEWLGGRMSEKTITHVSKSDEGLYRCVISGAGQSPDVRLAVLKQSEDTGPPVSGPLGVPTGLWMAAAALPVALLLFSLGLHLYRRHTAGSEDGDVIDSHMQHTLLSKQRGGEKRGKSSEQTPGRPCQRTV